MIFVHWGRRVALAYSETNLVNTLMNRLLPLALLLTAAVLSGCASHSPELRPYTAEETRELALEDLNRRGLSFDEYQVKKAQLISSPQIVHEFDNRGEMNAAHGVAHPDRQG
jgi:hypothetical protein